MSRKVFIVVEVCAHSSHDNVDSTEARRYVLGILYLTRITVREVIWVSLLVPTHLSMRAILARSLYGTHFFFSKNLYETPIASNAALSCSACAG